MTFLPFLTPASLWQRKKYCMSIKTHTFKQQSYKYIMFANFSLAYYAAHWGHCSLIQGWVLLYSWTCGVKLAWISQLATYFKCGYEVMIHILVCCIMKLTLLLLCVQVPTHLIGMKGLFKVECHGWSKQCAAGPWCVFDMCHIPFIIIMSCWRCVSSVLKVSSSQSMFKVYGVSIM